MVQLKYLGRTRKFDDVVYGLVYISYHERDAEVVANGLRTNYQVRLLRAIKKKWIYGVPDIVTEYRVYVAKK